MRTFYKRQLKCKDSFFRENSALVWWRDRTDSRFYYFYYYYSSWDTALNSVAGVTMKDYWNISVFHITHLFFFFFSTYANGNKTLPLEASDLNLDLALCFHALSISFFCWYSVTMGLLNEIWLLLWGQSFEVHYLFLHSRLARYTIIGHLLKQTKIWQVLSFRKSLISKDSDRPFPH